MVYYGTYTSERLIFHAAGNPNDAHYIMLTKSADTPTFFVTCCCDEEWGYELLMESNSDYERVKWNIMNLIFDCETMDELLEEISEVIEDGFEGLLVNECDGCCNCDHCDCDDE